jgi:hypothetical protein
MGFADLYLSKQKNFHPYITSRPTELLDFIVVIPAYCEPELTDSLESLWNCERPSGQVEVIIVINAPENAGETIKALNREVHKKTLTWIELHDDPGFRFYIMDRTDMPAKEAGVGLARKTGMDEALYRFNQINHPGGIILSFDADSICDRNYFTAIERTLSENPSIHGFDIYFEHPLSGNDFPLMVYKGIAEYELHLRYVNQFLRYAGFPHAFHTVGSCFGVKAGIYASQGGMNKRRAGEDFYFLHKIIPLGHFYDITATRVIPSPRTSDRVPFGTGIAIAKYISDASEQMLTYSPDSFLLLKSLFQHIYGCYRLPAEKTADLVQEMPSPLKEYLIEIGFIHALSEINANTGSADAFIRRFFKWFDAFRIIKYLNSVHRNHFIQIPVRESAIRYLQITGFSGVSNSEEVPDLLKVFRALERI